MRAVSRAMPRGIIESGLESDAESDVEHVVESGLEIDTESGLAAISTSKCDLVTAFITSPDTLRIEYHVLLALSRAPILAFHICNILRLSLFYMYYTL